ncbi:hypothetical protein AN960_09820 [Bacillus sp. FJAT-25509]|uniref:hypothetical protein n=1 Tax=Bacillus sp. FJAT-25509 TaxID=1712029 RepID=UPI0006F826E4|nr:hypothetical protein [Bacillus sp. FJAT-25509]KQL39256.1 hypothetical protein AN960_09820 [Bacillus sp. FJAT-25509]
MENLEIVLVDFPKYNLDKFVFEELNIFIDQVKSSHFFNNKTMKDVSFENISSFENILMPYGSGNIVLKQLDFGIHFQDVMVLFSFDKTLGDITLNFPETSLREASIKRMLCYFLKLKEKYSIPTVKFGFEPAIDADTCIVELNDGEYELNQLVIKIEESLNK